MHERDIEAGDEEIKAVDEYRRVHGNYISFLQQKAKLSWLRNGDENTAVFHRAIKERKLKNTVYGINTMEGIWVDNADYVNEAFLNYYQSLLGTARRYTGIVFEAIIAKGHVLDENQQRALMIPITAEEVKKALFSIPNEKSPGPDGFSAGFYKDFWSVVGQDITDVVMAFFQSGKLLKELNATVLALILKVKCPANVSEFRPIACCNVLYKCITKLLCVRMKSVLPDIITANQGDFILGRFIAHNIMICQDLVKQYGRKNSSPGVIRKMDMKKAYDSIDWNFMRRMLVALKFPEKFIELIMECVSSPKFTLLINCQLHGFFEGKRGLRQGDPMSPLLFVICMEYLTRTLDLVSDSPHFRFHPNVWE